MPFKPSSNLLFLHIPKTGGSSVEYALEVHPSQICAGYNELYISGTGKHLQHLTFREIHERYDFDYSNIDCFAIVRNPVDRALSEYKWRKAINSPMINGLSFTDFLDHLLELRDLNKIHKDPHFIPQCEFVQDAEICKSLSVFNLERGMEHVSAYLSKKMNKEINVPHANKSKKVRELAAPSHADVMLIKEIYKEDFSKFYPD